MAIFSTIWEKNTTGSNSEVGIGGGLFVGVGGSFEIGVDVKTLVQGVHDALSTPTTPATPEQKQQP